MNEIVKQILARKRNGIDCTETESAELKGFLRYLFGRARRGKLYHSSNISIISSIEELFPIEYSELLSEME